MTRRCCRRRTQVPAPTRAVADDRQPVPSADPHHVSILVGANLSFGILEGWERTALVNRGGDRNRARAGTHHLREMAAPGERLHQRDQRRHPDSVTVLWPYFFTSFISILSKYVLRLKGRHIWNPTNFGVSAMVLLAPATVTVLSIQWGNAVAPMAVIWMLGAVIVWRVGRAHISATYVVAFLLFSFVRSAVTGTPWLAAVAPITGPMYQLFIFFMITDPKTTVRSKLGQCVVVVIVAFVEMLMRLAEIVYAPFYALFVVGSIAMVAETQIRSPTRSVPTPLHA